MLTGLPGATRTKPRQKNPGYRKDVWDRRRDSWRENVGYRSDVSREREWREWDRENQWDREPRWGRAYEWDPEPQWGREREWGPRNRYQW